MCFESVLDDGSVAGESFSLSGRRQRISAFVLCGTVAC